MKKRILISIFFLLGLAAFAQDPDWTRLESEGKAHERHENALVQWGNKLLLIGGRGEKPVDVFDTEKEEWSQGAQPPFEVHHMQAVNLDGLIYVISGFTGGYPYETPLSHVLVYDPAEDLWATGPKIPENRRRGAAGAVVYNKKIYLVNGIINGHRSGWVKWLDEFDPYSNSWKKLPNAPQARDHLHAAVINNKLYVAGGRRSGSVEDKVFAGTVKPTNVYDFNSQSWEVLPDIPTPRAGSAAAVWNDKLLILGGESESQESAHNEVELFDPESRTWRELPAMQNGRHGTQAISFNGQVIIGAGSGNRGGGPELHEFEVLTSGEKINFKTDSLVKGALSVSVKELKLNGESSEVILENKNGNTAQLISYIQTDTPEIFKINPKLETPFVLAPQGRLRIKVTAEGTAAAEASLIIKSAGSSAPLEVLLKRE